MIPQSATWTGKDGQDERRENEEVNGCEDERRTEGGFNGVCVEPHSPGSVWTQRQQR